jgi:hypothetical protein
VSWLDLQRALSCSAAHSWTHDLVIEQKVSAMQLSREQRISMERYVTDPTKGRPGFVAPRAAQAALAALVDPAAIKASHVTSTAAEATTRWCIWAVTSARLAKVDISYSELNYDLAEENGRRDPTSTGKPVEPSSVEAWVRPLGNIVSFEFAGVQFDQFLNEKFRIYDLELVFSDGFGFRISGVSTSDNETARSRWEEFVNAIREGLPFWP